jgi:hypothetical protein
LRKKTPGNSRNLVTSLLAHERGFRWLDSSRDWFWAETGLKSSSASNQKDSLCGKPRPRVGPTGRNCPVRSDEGVFASNRGAS